MTIMDYYVSDGEQTRQGTSWQEAASRQFGINNDGGNYLVFVTAEYTNNTANRTTSLHVTLNGAEGILDEVTVAAGKYRCFSSFYPYQLNIGTYILALAVKSSNAADTITVRRMRLFVLKH